MKSDYEGWLIAAAGITCFLILAAGGGKAFGAETPLELRSKTCMAVAAGSVELAQRSKQEQYEALHQLSHQNKGLADLVAKATFAAQEAHDKGHSYDLIAYTLYTECLRKVGGV